MNYYDHHISLVEVPGEISLVIQMTGCPLGCEGCHSQDIALSNGFPLELDSLIENQGHHITCVCFMGGEWNNDFDFLLDTARIHGLKTCLYTGLEMEDLTDDILLRLDYVKTGRYIEELGGLASKTTNQRFYNLQENKEEKFYERR